MAVDRKQQMKEITERLEQGVKDIFTSEMYTTYLRTMAKFHNYSFNNTLLIAMQRPDATLVAGFNAWKNKFNRYVKKGEKGIQIIAPAPIKEVEEREKIDKDTGLAVLNENGEPEMERVEYVVPRFPRDDSLRCFTDRWGTDSVAGSERTDGQRQRLCATYGGNRAGIACADAV